MFAFLSFAIARTFLWGGTPAVAFSSRVNNHSSGRLPYRVC